MGLMEELQKKYNDARKARDAFVTNTLSLLISDLKYEKINRQQDLEDNDIILFIKKCIKEKTDAIIEFEKGARQDLVDKAQNEINYLKQYLPEDMPIDELKKIAKEVKKELGIDSPSGFGTLMKAVMEKVKGRADGKIVKDIVQEIIKE
jgi:uncharacterized protein